MTYLTQPTRATLIACLALLGSLAIWLRWDLHPATYFADELIPRAVVRHMLESHTLDTNWDHADWHGDYAGNFYDLTQYNFSSYHTALLGIHQLGKLSSADALPELALYRLASLVFQLATMGLVYLTGRQLAGQLAGVLAAGFFAVMPQAVVDAHYARPESFVILLVAAAIWLALQGSNRRPHLLAEGAVWGIAFACKFSFWPMALLALGWRCLREKTPATIFTWIAGFLVGVAVSAPYILRDPAGFLHGIHLLLTQYKPDGSALLPSAIEISAYIVAFFGAPALLLLLVPALSPQRQIRCLAFFILPVSIFYLLVFARQGVFFERNLSHLLPLWSLLFACGSITAVRGLPARWQAGSACVLATASLVWPLYLSGSIVHGIFRHGIEPDTLAAPTEIALQQQFPDSRILSPSLGLDMSFLDKLPANAMLRIPDHKVPGMTKLRTALAEKGFTQVAHVALPLGFLPYNQLQINHVPPGFIYFAKAPATRETTP